MYYTKNRWTDKSGAPLWTWLVAGFLAVGFIGISCFGFSRPYYLHFFNAERLERFSRPEKDNPVKIVAIGTSLTQCALYGDKKMERLAEESGKNIAFIRFTLPAVTIDGFFDITEAAINSPADIIFIESGIFGLDLEYYKYNNHDIHRSYLRMKLKEIINYMIPIRIDEQDNRHNVNYFDRAVNIETKPLTEDEIKKYKEKSVRYRVRNLSESADYKRLFNKAIEKGKVVVFLDLSRSKEAWNILPSALERDFDKIMAGYKETYDINFIKFPYRLPRGYYLDFAHLNAKGRKFYSEWFLDELASLMERTAP